MRKYVPKSVEIMGHRVTVTIIDKKKWKIPEAVAYWEPSKLQILIMRQSADQMAHCFLHELTHAVLDAMSHKLSRDEVFVDTFSGLLHQAFASAVR